MPRKAWIGTGALAFVGVTVAMIPPTKPIGGKTVEASRTSTPMARSQPMPGAASAERQQAPLPAEAASAGAAAEPVAPAPEQAAPAEAAQPPRFERERRDADADDDRDELDPVPVAPDIEAAFRAGYQWADHAGIEDRRDCRRWRGSPAEDGCRARVRERERHRDYDDDPTLR